MEKIYRVNLSIHDNHFDFRMEANESDMGKAIELIYRHTNFYPYDDLEYSNLVLENLKDDNFEETWDCIRESINEQYRNGYTSNPEYACVNVRHEIINDFLVEARFVLNHPFIDEEQDSKNLPQVIRQYPLTEYFVDPDDLYDESIRRLYSYYGRILEDHHYAYSVGKIDHNSFSIFFTPPFIEDVKIEIPAK